MKAEKAESMLPSRVLEASAHVGPALPHRLQVALDRAHEIVVGGAGAHVDETLLVPRDRLPQGVQDRASEVDAFGEARRARHLDQPFDFGRACAAGGEGGGGLLRDSAAQGRVLRLVSRLAARRMLLHAAPSVFF